MYYYVGVVLVRDDGAVIAQRRDNDPGIPEPDKWSICGGRREEGDLTLAHAAARELLEETGYRVEVEKLRLLDHDTFMILGGSVTRTVFWARYDGIQPIRCFEGQEIRFIGRGEIAELDFCDYYHQRYLLSASEKAFKCRRLERF